MRLDSRVDPDARAGRFSLHACYVPALLRLTVRTDLRVNSDWPDLHAEIAPEWGRVLGITGENTSKPGKHFGVTQGASGVAAIAAAPSVVNISWYS